MAREQKPEYRGAFVRALEVHGMLGVLSGRSSADAKLNALTAPGSHAHAAPDGNSTASRRTRRSPAAAWRRLLAEPTTKRRTPSGSVLGFLLELLTEEAAVARLEVAPVLLEPVPGGRSGARCRWIAETTGAGGLPAADELRLAAAVLGLPQNAAQGTQLRASRR